MAMIRCLECRKDISDKAATCPHCGAPVDAVAARAMQGASGRRALKWIGGGIALLILVRMCSSIGAPSNEEIVPTAPTPPVAAAKPVPDEAMFKTWAAGLTDESVPASLRESYAKNIIAEFPDRPEAAAAKEDLPKLSAQVEEEKTYGAWSYSNEEDGMSGKRIEYAAVASDNVLSLDFPYQGAQRGTLAIRRHPKWGNDVIVSIEKGQILCSSYECPVRIRFDDAQPVTYSGNEPADNSSETVFLPYSIAKKLQSAKRVKIEMNLYHNGVQVLEFNVKGFNPQRMKQQ
ncbi:hypothetical protein INQ41_04915 [Lysobacter ciconiae]|uniref:Zinc ribbon domain-containing protein n=1 Tax=Novilysobacter ciconiae TaxID=2781022 RepID=A0A7S6UHG5_9GAMM|nr:zinc ribbon domain-containing protein [Lysobacter ciconiae]QOW20367.1 hypothetical protein INQ41_04915 [Lysobacter ciconiae]